MTYIRSFLFHAINTIFTVVFCTIAPILVFWLPIYPRAKFLTIWNRVVIFLLRWVCGVKYRVVGLNNVPTETVVFASKHQSAWETYFLQLPFQRPLSTILKRELLRIPFFGWCLAMMRPIAIDRSNPKDAIKQILTKGTRRIEEGMSVLVFPEGTRSKPKERGKYARGAASIAEKSGVAVVPIALNAGECWPAKSLLIYPGTISVVIGAPIDSKDKSARQITQELEDWIESQMLEINGTARD